MMLKHVQKFFLLILLLSLFSGLQARAAAPLMRMKAGFSSLTVNAGSQVKDQSLNSMATLQPSILWEVPEFSSRIGVHYLMELGGTYGMTSLTGIGVSAYYHFFGISTSYSVQEDGRTFITRSRPGPYLYGSITPANLNLNIFDEQDTSKNIHPSILIYDFCAGAGYDYPLNQNLVMSAEIALRNGAGASSGSTEASYSGMTFFLSFATTYF